MTGYREFDPDASLRRLIAERLKQHSDNLALWESGYLAPTEPDPDERHLTMERLRAAIHELRYLQENAS